LIEQWIIEDIRKEIKKFLELSENEDTSYQNPWNAAKTVLKRMFIIMSAHIRKLERFQIIW
jgi:hypothetical protein